MNHSRSTTGKVQYNLILDVTFFTVIQFHPPKQCCGSMTFWGGSGSGSADPCLCLMDPDPASDPDSDPDPSILVIDLQDASKKLIF
jgi:hypothetical protein